MNKNFETLKPALVWKHFKNIMDIPHPSRHEEGIRKYAVDFAAKRGLDYTIDEVGNVIIRKDACEGMESTKGIILQAHMDMVPQKNSDKEFDFLRDPIEGYIDGEWVRANGTTLGADNGVGMAMALAALEDETLSHGELEVLLTINEEIGLEGAFALKEDMLRGEILLNLDTEDDDELCIGCAGGLDLIATFEHDMVPTPQGDYVARRLEITGLKGGHSGTQINEQRANANKILFRLLRLTKIELLLASVSGGTLRNAIPREATATLLVHNDDIEIFEEQVAKYQATIESEYGAVEDGVSISLCETEYPEMMIEENAAACLVWAVAGAPDGVHKMSYSIPNLVQTSSNIGVINSSEEGTRVEILIRSSSESEKVELADSIASIFELADAEVSCEGGYPGWLPNIDSPILEIMRRSYRELFNDEPKVNAVHAGLECGIIGSNYPNLDMISFGPTIVSPHSPDECVNIASVERVYKYLCHTIENAPKIV